MPPITIKATHRGRTSWGVDYVSDGSLLILAELCDLSPFGGYTEIPASFLDASLTRAPAVWAPLETLVPSQLRADVSWAPGDVALANGYVGQLRALGRTLDLGPFGPKDAVLIREGTRMIGMLMPLDYPPERPIPRPAEPATPPAEPPVHVARALAEAHDNGLLLDMDLAAFQKRLHDLHGRDVGTIDSESLLNVLQTHYLGEGAAYLAGHAEHGVVVTRDVHEGEEADILFRLLRFAAHFGALHELRAEIARHLAKDDGDLLDDEDLFLLLGRAFERAGRAERIHRLGADANGTAFVLRGSIVHASLRIFARAEPYLPGRDRASAPATAPVYSPPPPPPPPPPPVVTGPPSAPAASKDQVLRLERYEASARTILVAAQRLADERVHHEMEPIHVAAALVRQLDPARARVSLQIVEREIARLPKAQPGQLAYLSASTLALLKEAEQLATGRLVEVADLWRAIRRARGSVAAMILEAAAPD
ncbi:MAG: hypothetical protein U0441_26615 [Polyangiaceae bacterium]